MAKDSDENGYFPARGSTLGKLSVCKPS